MEDINDNTNNLYIIKRRLAELKRSKFYPNYQYYVGRFKVYIHCNYNSDNPDIKLLNCNQFDVGVYELERYDVPTHLDLRIDARFSSYKPIMYNYFEGPNGIVNFSDGLDMPLVNLCELIKYLHRLSNLTAFM